MDILDQKGQPIQRKKKVFIIVYEWLVIKLKTCFPILISVVALFISIRSCSISEDANTLAYQAIQTSSDQFFKENKPYIVINLRKIKETQSYYKYTLLSSKNAVKLEFEYNVKNIGSVAAKDIAEFNKLIVDNAPNLSKVDFQLPNKITLGPKESYVMEMESTLVYGNRKGYENYVKALSTETGPEITIQTGVTYLSELNPELKFNSIVAHKITKSHAEIIKMEYEEE